MSHIRKVTVKKAVDKVDDTSCPECEITSMLLGLMDKKQPSMS